MSDRLDQLYRRYAPAVYARCRRVLGDAIAAEDAVQEVFVRAHRHGEKVPDDEHALRWLYRVSTNYCLNVIRNDKRRQELDLRNGSRESANPEAALLDRNAARQLLRMAPERLRSVVMLYYLDDMDQQAVAEILGVTTRTVINRLNAFRDWAQRKL